MKPTTCPDCGATISRGSRSGLCRPCWKQTITPDQPRAAAALSAKARRLYAEQARLYRELIANNAISSAVG